MPITLFRWLVPAGLLLDVTSLQAQSNLTTRQPDPNDPSVVVPAAQYRSGFDGYRYLRDEPVLSWKESNDLVGRIGGWRVYAREAAPAESPSGTPSGTPPGTPSGTSPATQPATQPSKQSAPLSPSSGQGGTGTGHEGHKR
jgi:hypothetical protein